MTAPLRSYNLKQEEVLTDIKKRLEAQARYYSRIRVRCVAIASNSRWKNALCIIHAFPRNILPPEEKSSRYMELHLLEAWLKPEELPSLLEQLISQTIIIDGEPISLDQTTRFQEWEYLPGNNDYSTYPGVLYQTTRSSGAEGRFGDPLLAYNLPFYPNAYEAIRHWSAIKRFHGHADARIGCLLLFLPECRARFKNFNYRDNVLEISIEAGEPPVSGLRIKGAWQELGLSTSFNDPAASAEVSIDVPSQAEAFEIYLVGPDETVYDFRRETRFWTIGLDRILQTARGGESDEATVREAVQRGEGESLEFKPYIAPDDRKQQELIDTTVAFANTRGGSIFIGIDNYCAIAGIETEIGRAKPVRTRELSLEAAIERYVGQLRQTIVGALNRSPRLEFTVIKIDGHIVVLIRVPEGDGKPYFSLQNRIVYIRRGANNVAADPDYELPAILRSTHR